MNITTLFWLIVIGLALFFALLAVREMFLLVRIPRGHPERGMYWCNVFILPMFAIGVLFLGHIIDTKRISIEEIIPTPPATQYAIFRNGLFVETEWVFATQQTTLEVRNFYRQYAKMAHITSIEDERDATRMSFALPSGNLFLTVREEGGHTLLYFSRDGEIRTVASKEGVTSE